MSKKVKVLVSMLVVLIFALAVPTAMVMAQEDESTTTPLAGQFIARVAEILGIDQEEMKNAFEQAREEMREEAPDWCTENATADCIKERLANRQQIRQMLREQMINGAAGSETSGARISQAIRGRHMIAVPNGWKGPITYQPSE